MSVLWVAWNGFLALVYFEYNQYKLLKGARMYKKNVVILLITILSINMYSMERQEGSWLVSRTVDADSIKENTKLLGCTIMYNPITKKTPLLKHAMLIGCTIQPSSGFVKNYLPTSFLSRIELDDVVGFWVDIPTGVKAKTSSIIGLETPTLPEHDDFSYFVPKDIVKFVGGGMAVCLGTIIYLFK